MPENLRDLYLNGAESGSKSTPEPSSSLRELYMPSSTPKTAVDPIAESTNTPQLPSAFSKAASSYGDTLSKQARGGLETFYGGLEDIGSSRPYTGLGKLGLGGAEYMFSPFTSATEEVGKYAAGIGGPEFGKKVEFLAGSALPISGVGYAVNASRPTVRAVKDIVKNIGQENLPEVLQRIQSNPRLTVMDASPTVRTVTQGLAADPASGGMQHLANAYKQRTSTERSIVESAHNDLMGPVPNVKKLMDDIKESTKKVGTDIINPAIKAAGPVDISSVLQHIDDRSKTGINAVVSAGQPLPDDFLVKGLKDVRKFLTDDKQQLTDAQRLHNIQSAIRTKAETLLSSPNGQDRLMGYELFKVREKLVDSIDTASGTIDPISKMGPYKSGLSQYKVEKEFPEAIEKGMQIFKNNPNQLENRPEFWKSMIENSTEDQVRGLKIGARLAADNQIRGMRFASRKGENIPEIEFNAERLQHLFGKTETDNYRRILGDEKDMAEVNNILFHGSKTASTLLGQQARKVRDPISISDAAKSTVPFAILEGANMFAGGVAGVGTGAAIGLGGLKKIANIIGRKLDTKANLEYAKMATATGDEKEQLIKMLEEHLPKPKQSVLNRVGQTAQNLALPILPP